jgi:hypothetical protein
MQGEYHHTQVHHINNKREIHYEQAHPSDGSKLIFCFKIAHLPTSFRRSVKKTPIPSLLTQLKSLTPDILTLFLTGSNISSSEHSVCLITKPFILCHEPQ